MATSAQAYPAAVRSPLYAATVKVARVGMIVSVVVMLAFSRFIDDPVARGAIGLASLVAIYLALGRESRTWAAYIVAFVLFAQLRSYADDFGMTVRFVYPIDAEKALFAGSVPTIWLQERLYSFGQLGAIEAYTVFIYTSYFFVPHIAAFCLWKWDRPHFRRYALAIMATLYVGLLVSILVPTAPPWLAGQLGYIPHVHRVIPDLSATLTPGAYQQAYDVAGANDVAAMPSLHAAVPWLMAIAFWRYKPVRPLALTYALSMTFAIVYLGEHYVVDAVAGLAVAAACWAGVGALTARYDGLQWRREEAAQALPVTAVAAADTSSPQA